MFTVAQTLLISFCLKLYKTGVASHQGELLFIFRVFRHCYYLLERAASQKIYFNLSKISLIEELNEPIGHISLSWFDGSDVSDKNGPEPLGNSSKVSISHDGIHQLPKLIDANGISCPWNCDLSSLNWL